MRKGMENPLVYVILLIFVGLCITVYLLFNNKTEVRSLESHKRFLMDQLSEEVFLKKMLKHENDSLKKVIFERGMKEDTLGPVDGV